MDALDLTANSQEIHKEKIRANTEEDIMGRINKKNSQKWRLFLLKLKGLIKYPVKVNRKNPTFFNASEKFQNIKDKEDILRASRERKKSPTKECVNDTGLLVNTSWSYKVAEKSLYYYEGKIIWGLNLYACPIYCWYGKREEGYFFGHVKTQKVYFPISFS